MKIFMYVSDKATTASLTEYAKEHYKKFELIEEDSPLMSDWCDRALNDLINRAVSGDKIVVLDALSLAQSHMQVLSFFEAALEKGIKVQFIRYGLIFNANPTCNFSELIDLIREIENDFISQRNLEIMTRRNKHGIRLGRPAGGQNASLKLDKFKSDIVGYLGMSLNKISIAKLIDCHPQTLAKWLKRNELKQKRSPSRRSKKTESIDS